MFISKESYWMGTSDTIRNIRYYNIFALLGKNYKLGFMCNYIPYYIVSGTEAVVADVLQNRYSWKFCKSYTKITLLESLLWNLLNIWEHVFLRSTSSGCFSEEKVSSKRKHSKSRLFKRNLPFQDILYHFAYLYFSTTARQILHYTIKEVDRIEELYSL